MPGGAVVGNNKVWRALSFAPLVTTEVRVVLRKGAGGCSRVVEVEAY